MRGMLFCFVTGAGAALGLAACQTSMSYVFGESDLIKLAAVGFAVASGPLRSTITADEITVTPVKPEGLCDVSIDIVTDSNGDGQPGNQGDLVRPLLTLPGVFRGHSFGHFSLTAEQRLTKAYFRVRGRLCSEKELRVLAVFEVNANGFTPRGPEAVPEIEPTLAFATDGSRPHFLEFRVLGRTGDRLRVTVGDLATVRSPLHHVYASVAPLPAPDFLGAAVFVDDQFVQWLSGPGHASVELPIRAGRLGRVQVVSLDRSLRLVGNWRMDDLRF